MHNPDRRPEYFKNQPKGDPVGWCTHNKHRGKLSVKIMKSHKCLSKNCRFFKKNEDHPYWAERENIKKLKKENKKKDTVFTQCETCEYMYRIEPKPGKTAYAKHMVRYCGYQDAGKTRHYYCSTRNRNNRCPHYHKLNKDTTENRE